MKKILTVLFLVAISLSVFACDGDDGERGAMGITGPSGLDKLLDPDAEYTEKQQVRIAELEKVAYIQICEDHEKTPVTTGEREDWTCRS